MFAFRFKVKGSDRWWWLTWEGQGSKERAAEWARSHGHWSEWRLMEWDPKDGCWKEAR